MLCLKRQDTALHLNYLRTVPHMKTYGSDMETIAPYLRHQWVVPEALESWMECSFHWLQLLYNESCSLNLEDPACSPKRCWILSLEREACSKANPVVLRWFWCWGGFVKKKSIFYHLTCWWMQPNPFWIVLAFEDGVGEEEQVSPASGIYGSSGISGLLMYAFQTT